MIDDLAAEDLQKPEVLFRIAKMHFDDSQSIRWLPKGQ